jgi:hypothetical protein
MNGEVSVLAPRGPHRHRSGLGARSASAKAAGPAPSASAKASARSEVAFAKAEASFAMQQVGPAAGDHDAFAVLILTTRSGTSRKRPAWAGRITCRERCEPVGRISLAKLRAFLEAPLRELRLDL